MLELKELTQITTLLDDKIDVYLFENFDQVPESKTYTEFNIFVYNSQSNQS